MIEDRSVVIHTKKVSTREDQAVNFYVVIDMGDEDSSESIKTLTFQKSTLAGGSLTRGNQLLSGNDDYLVLTHDQLPKASRDKNTGHLVLSIDDLSYTPKDYASNATFHGGRVNILIRCSISSSLGDREAVSVQEVNVLGVANKPLWSCGGMLDVDIHEDGTFVFSQQQVFKASVQDNDGSEILFYRITKLPVGGILLSDNSALTLDSTVNREKFSSVKYAPYPHFKGQDAFEVTAVSREKGEAVVLENYSPVDVSVRVHPVADLPELVLLKNKLVGKEDEMVSIGEHITLSSPDSSESLIIEVREKSASAIGGAEPGTFFCLDPDNRNNILKSSRDLSPEDIFSVPEEWLPGLVFKPAEHISTRTRGRMLYQPTIEVVAVSREETVQGVEPVQQHKECRSAPKTLAITIESVPDEPTITLPPVSPDNPSKESVWSLSPTERNVISGVSKESEPMALKITFQSGEGDHDSSESLFCRLEMSGLPRGFFLSDSQGMQPPIIEFISGKPAYGLKVSEMAEGRWSLNPAPHYAGMIPQLPLDIIVLEADGNSQIFHYWLKWEVLPAVSDIVYSTELVGYELTVADGKYQSGGASLRLPDIGKISEDKSEHLVDVLVPMVPQGFGVYYINGDHQYERLIAGSSMKAGMQGLSAVEKAFSSGAIRIFPEKDSTFLDTDFPVSAGQTLKVRLEVTVSDQPDDDSGEAIEPKLLALAETVFWRGRVDGPGRDGGPSFMGEDTRFQWKGADQPVRCDQGVLALGQSVYLTSTDADSSETLLVNHDRTPWKISLKDWNHDVITDAGWLVEASGRGTSVIFAGQGEWLIDSESLDYVSLRIFRDGDYRLVIHGLIEDVGDIQSRGISVHLRVENAQSYDDRHNFSGKIQSSQLIPATEDKPVKISEFLDPELLQSLPYETVFRVNKAVYPSDGHVFSSFTLSGPGIKMLWDDKGSPVAWLIPLQYVQEVTIIPEGHQAGKVDIYMEWLTVHPGSGLPSVYSDALHLDIVPVADKPVLSLNGKGHENSVSAEGSDDRLSLSFKVIDASEHINEVEIYPADGVNIQQADKGKTNMSGYVFFQQPAEGIKAFYHRLETIAVRIDDQIKGSLSIKVKAKVVDVTDDVSDEKWFSWDVPFFVHPVNSGVDITVSQQSGRENNDIPLVGLSIKQHDPDEMISSILLKNIPDKFLVRNAGLIKKDSLGNGTWLVPDQCVDNEGNLNDLVIVPRKDCSGIFSCQLVVIGKEKGLDSFLEEGQLFDLHVSPEANPLTFNTLGELSGTEQDSVLIGIGLRTSDEYFQAEGDLQETITLRCTLIPDASSQLTPNTDEQWMPSIRLDNQDCVFSHENGKNWNVEIPTALSTIDAFYYMPNVGHGSGILAINAWSVDRSDGLEASHGMPIIQEAMLTIKPVSHMPDLSIGESTVHPLDSGSVRVDFDIQLTGINPVISVNNVAGTELYIQITGVSENCRFGDRSGTDLGLLQQDGSWVIPVNSLSDLSLYGLAADSRLGFQGISDAGDGNSQRTEIKFISLQAQTPESPVDMEAASTASTRSILDMTINDSDTSLAYHTTNAVVDEYHTGFD
ncbi:hypothetical protein CI610_02617 [invertebrate metagenome]|uniref:Uncharacterized protein n=1 Tax=invertebrate metagenome TaxID=1711999 RepID=A0A2H9T5G0_9ZZZZ